MTQLATATKPTRTEYKHVIPSSEEFEDRNSSSTSVPPLDLSFRVIGADPALLIRDKARRQTSSVVNIVNESSGVGVSTKPRRAKIYELLLMMTIRKKVASLGLAPHGARESSSSSGDTLNVSTVRRL